VVTGHPAPGDVGAAPPAAADLPQDARVSAATQAPPAVRTVAAFDFDGTLTHRDSLVPFLMRVRGRTTVLRALAANAPALARTVVDADARHHAKEALLIATVRGWWLDELRPFADDYARHIVDTQLRPDRLARLHWHQQQGHDVVLVSASPELYVGAVARLLGCSGAIATQLEVDRRGRVTGRIFGANVRGAEKERLLRDWLAETGDQPVHLYAYGDSEGDADMLAMADVPTRLRPRRRLSERP
jgi:HAD superfamily hydrolase (TIGR01490 family)